VVVSELIASYLRVHASVPSAQEALRLLVRRVHDRPAAMEALVQVE
jgi:hypothetical protein